ncbi:putative transcription factor NAM family [Helianthus annuus]|nr:putative transcription factor NAM family [Helianthus annuus]KAJ0440924.1 putative transcription factor NAM family [Helianthus annuus]KAJ0459002.1 putative transcription factor NAM family [Helianthus annuus]KAJ0639546.1 putative transcription factor NAM family [Helianthus annuus]KAJ0834164.1 putative transcription factor NAM family [Helianthus annuus]
MYYVFKKVFIFRFSDFNRCPIHLVDEELIGYYLKGKVQGLEIELEVIPLVEMSKCDPWELPGELCFFNKI